MEFMELIYKLKALKKENMTSIEYCYRIFELLLKINYNLMIEEEAELLATLEEIGCSDYETWFDNETIEVNSKLFWAVVYIRSLMMTLTKCKIEDNFSDLFPITPDDEISIWVKENKSLVKQKSKTM